MPAHKLNFQGQQGRFAAPGRDKDHHCRNGRAFVTQGFE